MTNTEPRTLKTIERTIMLITYLMENNSGRVTEMADELDTSPSTVYNHLMTLEQNRFVIKEGEEYKLGLRFLSVGGWVRDNRQVYTLAQEKVRQIAEKTGERAQLIVEEHGRVIVLSTETGEDAVVADTFAGKASCMHASAAGKAILSRESPEYVDKVVDRWGLPALTTNTITDRDQLHAELRDIHDRRYSYNDEESIQGLRAIGAPLVGPNEDVVGALSVSGPTRRLKGARYREKIPNILLGAANEIELKIEYKQNDSE